jgi:hypothetical protein
LEKSKPICILSADLAHSTPPRLAAKAIKAPQKRGAFFVTDYPQMDLAIL